MKKLGIKELFMCCLSLLSSGSLLAQSDETLLSFGIIADIQYADCDESGSRYYRNSISKLEESLDGFKDKKVSFVVNLGDIIDRKAEDINAVIKSIKSSKLKFYHTTGNHDYADITDNNALYKRLDMPKSYYSFSKRGWRFIMLNTNEVASYSNPTPELRIELDNILDAVKSQGRKCGAPWNGAVSREQLEWFNSTLADAESSGEKVIVFSHHPLFPDNEYSALNSPEILKVISRYKCVKSFVSGHHHEGGNADFNGIASIIVEGVVETAHSTAYMVVEITKNSVELQGFGRCCSYHIDLD